MSSFYPRSFCYPQLEQMLRAFPTVCYPGLSTGPTELSKVRIPTQWSLSLIIPPHIPLRKTQRLWTALHSSSWWRNLVGHQVNHPETEPVLFFCLSWQDMADCLPGVTAGLRCGILSGIVAGLTVGTFSLWKSRFPARLWDDGGFPSRECLPGLLPAWACEPLAQRQDIHKTYRIQSSSFLEVLWLINNQMAHLFSLPLHSKYERIE